MKYSCLLLIFIFASCSTSKYALKNKENIETMKQFAYCECLKFSIEKFVGKDSVDISGSRTFDYFELVGGFFIRRIFPVLDSAAKSISIEEAKHQFHTGPTQVAEGTNGKVQYKMDCLNFYKSKQLDSLVRALNGKINDTLRNDEWYHFIKKK